MGLIRKDYDIYTVCLLKHGSILLFYIIKSLNGVKSIKVKLMGRDLEIHA